MALHMELVSKLVSPHLGVYCGKFGSDIKSMQRRKISELPGFGAALFLDMEKFIIFGPPLATLLG